MCAIKCRVCMLNLRGSKTEYKNKCGKYRKQEGSAKKEKKIMSSAILPTVCRLHAFEIFHSPNVSYLTSCCEL